MDTHQGISPGRGFHARRHGFRARVAEQRLEAMIPSSRNPTGTGYRDAEGMERICTGMYLGQPAITPSLESIRRRMASAPAYVESMPR